MPLSLSGLVRMQAAADAGPPWDRVISSPLSRCAEFAHAYARRHCLPLSLDPRLQEMGFGAWEGRSAEELMATTPDALRRFWADPWTRPPPGGEPLDRLQERVLQAWEAILIGSAHDDHILVVTHGGVIRILLCHLLHLPPARLLELEVGHASLQRLRVGWTGGCPEVRLLDADAR